MLAKLTRLHAELFGALAELEFLTRNEAPDRGLLTEVRWNLTRASIERTRFLEDQVYPLLLGILPPANAESVCRLKEDGVRLRGVSSTHICNWPIEKISADWQHYCSASDIMRAAMRRRIGEEKSILYPLLASVGFKLPGELAADSFSAPKAA